MVIGLNGVFCMTMCALASVAGAAAHGSCSAIRLGVSSLLQAWYIANSLALAMLCLLPERRTGPCSSTSINHDVQACYLFIVSAMEYPMCRPTCCRGFLRRRCIILLQYAQASSFLWCSLLPCVLRRRVSCTIGYRSDPPHRRKPGQLRKILEVRSLCSLWTAILRYAAIKVMERKSRTSFFRGV